MDPAEAPECRFEAGVATTLECLPGEGPPVLRCASEKSSHAGDVDAEVFCVPCWEAPDVIGGRDEMSMVVEDRDSVDCIKVSGATADCTDLPTRYDEGWT